MRMFLMIILPLITPTIIYLILGAFRYWLYKKRLEQLTKDNKNIYDVNEEIKTSKLKRIFYLFSSGVLLLLVTLLLFQILGDHKDLREFGYNPSYIENGKIIYGEFTDK